MSDFQKVYVVNQPRVVFTITGLEVVAIMGVGYVIVRVYQGGIDALVSDIQTLINITLPALVRIVPQLINTIVILIASSVPEITKGFGVVIPVVISSVFKAIPNLVGSIGDFLKSIIKPFSGSNEYESGPDTFVSTNNEKYIIKWTNEFYFWNDPESRNPRYHDPMNELYVFLGANSVLVGVWVRLKKELNPDYKKPGDNPYDPDAGVPPPAIRPDIPDEGERFKDGVQILPIEFHDAPFVNPILEPYDPNKGPKNLDPYQPPSGVDLGYWPAIIFIGVIGLFAYNYYS